MKVESQGEQEPRLAAQRDRLAPRRNRNLRLTGIPQGIGQQRIVVRRQRIDTDSVPQRLDGAPWLLAGQQRLRQQADGGQAKLHVVILQ